MAEKKKSEAVEMGDFHCRDTSDSSATEIRLQDEKSQSSIIIRKAGLKRALEDGVTYRIWAEKIADAPGVATVTATIRAEDVGSLPRDAVIEKGDVVVQS